jgi:hypothetical protein
MSCFSDWSASSQQVAHLLNVRLVAVALEPGVPGHPPGFPRNLDGWLPQEPCVWTGRRCMTRCDHARQGRGSVRPRDSGATTVLSARTFGGRDRAA